MEQFGAIVFEIEMEIDERPVCAVILGEGIFNQRFDPFEEVGFEIRLGPSRLGAVGKNYTALVPRQVLLDRDRVARAKRAVDTIDIASVVRIAVMGVYYGLSSQVTTG